MKKFEVNDTQIKKIDKWISKLKKKHPSDNGNRIQYIFEPTGIGDILMVRDIITGEELDATDYKSF